MALSLAVSRSPVSISRPSPSLSSKSHFFSNVHRAYLLNHNNLATSLVVSRSRGRAHRGLRCNCLFGLGVPELVVIAGVAALVFGPKNLPELGRSIGKTVRSFQEAAKEFGTELKKDPDPVPAEKQASTGDDVKQPVKASSNED